MIVLINWAILAIVLYVMWCGLKWIILRPDLPEKQKKQKIDSQESASQKESAAQARARKYGRRRPTTVDGGVIYPEKDKPEEVLLLEDKR